MSKAEEKANNAHPINKGSGIDRVISMVNRKNGYIQGYMQAEKDLALTIEDIRLICEIDEDMRCHSDWPLRGQEVYYEEVLRRFCEIKDK